MTEIRPGMLNSCISMPSQFRDEWHDWINNEHIVERMRVPGFLHTARYAAEDARLFPQFMANYDLEAADVMRTRAYWDQADTDTVWTARLFHQMWNPMTRRIYEQRTVGYEALPPGACTGLWFDGIDVVEEREPEFESWLDDTYLPALRSLSGIERVRSFRNVNNVGPRHMILADAALTAVFRTSPFLALQADATKVRRKLARGVSFGIYGLIFEHPETYQPGERAINWSAATVDYGRPAMAQASSAPRLPAARH